MGSAHSIRATHFQRPAGPRATVETVTDDECDDDHAISITNKMVERLVEDATLAGGATSANTQTIPKGDYRDQVYIDKLKSMDDKHSERCGLSVDNLSAMAARIDLRTSNMISTDPVCAECKEKVIECYNNNYENMIDAIKCWDTVGDFTKCVSNAAAARLRARSQKEEREHARRTRHVAHAREHALRDLGPTAVID